jgi:hypothetical protein
MMETKQGTRKMEYETDTDTLHTYSTAHLIDELLKTLRSIEPEKVAELLLKEHRTNQQTIIGNLYTIIDYIAEAHERQAYDMRNEDALLIAREMRDAKIMLGYSEKTRLPYI